MPSKDWMLEFEPAFAAIWKAVAPYTMTSPQRGYALWRAVNYVIDNDIPGSFVECGLWKGGSAMLMALTLVERGVKRNLFLFDTFDGMTAPTGADRDMHGRAASEYLEGKHGQALAELVSARTTLTNVKEAIASTGYDSRFVYFVPGDVGDTLQRTQTLHISLLRLDTDFYDSTLAELVNLYPRVSRGGVVIVDDYGHWQGAKKAVDEYFADPVSGSAGPMLWAIDYTGRGFVKMEECKRAEIERYDYVPSGMTDPAILKSFPFAVPINPWAVKWPYLRPSVPHVFRSDTRSKKKVIIGNASYEEAICLHNVALQFAGKRGLEIGSHFGWTSAHLRAAGLELDLIDPEFADPDRRVAVEEVMNAISIDTPYRLWPLYSPQDIPQVRAEALAPWSFVFIDGDHDGEAPERDAFAVMDNCADDAIVMFHDMTSPHVTRGLKAFDRAGWKVGLFNTMQVLGIAWRGDVVIPKHVRDPSVPHILQPHLKDIPMLSV